MTFTECLLGNEARAFPQLTAEGPGLAVGLLSTYPPTECGLATFAAASRTPLAHARPSWDVSIIEACAAVTSRAPLAPSHSAPEVSVRWWPSCRRSFNAAVAFGRQLDCLIVEHEFGIYAGSDGSDVLELLDAIDVPVVAVLHTVLRSPTPGQRAVVDRLGERSEAIVVMSEAARGTLLRNHPMLLGSTVVIPHGAHWARYRDPLGSGRSPLLLTWGLVGPGKGLELAIDAVADVVASGVPVRYRICGETHPKVRAQEGERYRRSLVERVRALGLEGIVTFDDRYRSVPELLGVIEEADLVLIPYDSREQVTSGVLVEALAAGKAVVATAFPHAREALATGAGIVVTHDDRPAMASAIVRVLTEPGCAVRMSRQARAGGAPMLWPAVGEALAALVEAVVPGGGDVIATKPYLAGIVAS